MNEELPLPRAGKYGFFIGAMIGAVSWVIASPILGVDIVGKIVGSVLVGIFGFFLLRRYGYRANTHQNNSIPQIVWSVFVAFMAYAVIHLGGLNLAFKKLMDYHFQSVSDNTWAFSYMLSFGLLGLMIGGFIEAVKDLSNNPNV